MDEDLKEDLLECDTLNEMWETLDCYYDLDHSLGTITKKIVVAKFVKNISKLIQFTRTPEREYEEEEEEQD